MYGRSSTATVACSSLAPHLAHFLSDFFNYFSLFEIARQMLLSIQSSVWQGRLYSLNLYAVIAVVVL